MHSIQDTTMIIANYPREYEWIHSLHVPHIEVVLKLKGISG